MKLKRKVVSSILAGSLVMSCGAVSFAKESVQENKVESINTDSKTDTQSKLDTVELEEHSGYIMYAGAEEDYPVVEMDTLDEDYIVTKINGEESKREDYKKVQSRVVVYTQNSDGELQLYTTQQAYEDGNEYGDYEFITGQIVDERGGKSVEIEDISGKIKFIDIGSDTNIFEDCDKVEDVEIDDMVTILTDGRKALTVKIYDMDEDLDIDIAKENGLDESSFDIKDSANDLIDEADYILNRVEELKESKINLQKALETNNKEDIKDNIQELKEIIEEIK